MWRVNNKMKFLSILVVSIALLSTFTAASESTTKVLTHFINEATSTLETAVGKLQSQVSTSNTKIIQIIVTSAANDVYQAIVDYTNSLIPIFQGIFGDVTSNLYGEIKEAYESLNKDGEIPGQVKTAVGLLKMFSGKIKSVIQNAVATEIDGFTKIYFDFATKSQQESAAGVSSTQLLTEFLPITSQATLYFKSIEDTVLAKIRASIPGGASIPVSATIPGGATIPDGASITGGATIPGAPAQVTITTTQGGNGAQTVQTSVASSGETTQTVQTTSTDSSGAVTVSTKKIEKHHEGLLGGLLGGVGRLLNGVGDVVGTAVGGLASIFS